MKRWGWLIALCWSVVGLAAVEEQPSVVDYYRQLYTTRDGLPHNTINAINQTQDGYLWFGGWEGLSRFNGREFEWFSRQQLAGFPDSGVMALAVRKDGTLAIGGTRGSLVFLKPGQVSRGPTLTGTITDMVEDNQHNLWVTTDSGGLNRVGRDGQVRTFTTADSLPAMQLHKIIQTFDNRMWVASARGLFWFDPALESPRFQKVQRFDEMDVTAVAEAYSGALLVGSERGAFLLNQQVSLLHPDLANVTVSNFIQDNQGSLWISTQDKGLFRYAEGRLEQLDRAQGLPDSRILSLYFDVDNNLWIGTNTGLMRLRRTPFRTLTMQQGLSSNYVRTLLKRQDGSIWIGTSAGLDIYQQGNVSQFPLPATMRINSFRSLAEASNGDVWLGTFTDGVMQVRDGKVIQHFTRKDGLAADLVYAVLPQDNGDTWIGTSAGLTLFSNGKFKSFHSQDGLPGEFVTSIRQDAEGVVWIATSRGLARWQDGKLQPLVSSVMAPAEQVFDFWFEPKTPYLWLTTDRGLIRYNKVTNQASLLSLEQRFPVEKIFTMMLDVEGYFWISSNHGIIRLEKADAEAVLAGTKSQLTSAELLGVNDGMRDAQCNGGSMTGILQMDDGTLWFATAGGIARIHSHELQRYTNPAPPVVIESIHIDNQEKQPQDLSITSQQRRIKIDYVALSFLSPTRIRYRTKLVGFDDDWVERGGQLSAEYTNLKPGIYQFEVMAAYPDSDWSHQAARLTITVQAVWWQRLEVMVASLLMLVLLGVLGYRWHLRNLARHLSQLQQRVRLQESELQIQAEQLSVVEQDQRHLASMFSHPSVKLDPSSGLPTAERMMELLLAEMNRSHRHHSKLSVLKLELAGFSDSLSRLEPTQAEPFRQLMAQLLSEQLRLGDWLGHWDAQFYLVVLPSASVEDAAEIAERMKIAARLFFEQHQLLGTVSTAVFSVQDNMSLQDVLTALNLTS